jgi:hypothetical protein
MIDKTQYYLKGKLYDLRLHQVSGKNGIYNWYWAWVNECTRKEDRSPQFVSQDEALDWMDLFSSEILKEKA